MRYLLLFLFCSASFALEVRVKNADGVPRIHIDDIPVRPRFFYGMPSSRKRDIKAGETQIEVEYTAVRDFNDRFTLQFRVGRRSSSKMAFDDISLVDTVTGEAIIGKVDFEGDEQDFTSVFRFWPTLKDAPYATLGVVDGVGSNGSKGLLQTLQVREKDGLGHGFHFIPHPKHKLVRGEHTSLASGEKHCHTWVCYAPQTTQARGILHEAHQRWALRKPIEARRAIGYVVRHVPMPVSLAGRREHRLVRGRFNHRLHPRRDPQRKTRAKARCLAPAMVAQGKP